jgi:hypothetical protein
MISQAKFFYSQNKPLRLKFYWFLIWFYGKINQSFFIQHNSWLLITKLI